MRTMRKYFLRERYCASRLYGVLLVVRSNEAHDLKECGAVKKEGNCVPPRRYLRMSSGRVSNCLTKLNLAAHAHLVLGVYF
jgi:hypothetical protein